MNTKYVKLIVPYIILIALISISTIGIACSFSYEKYATIELQSYKHNLIDAQYANVSDCYGLDGIPQMSELFMEKDSLQRLKGFNNDLNTYFNFYEVFVQPVEYVLYYTGPSKFVDGYDLGYADELMNQKLYNGKKHYYLTPLNAVQIGLRAMIDFDLESKMEKGRCFTTEECVVKTKLKVIPVLLGYDYEQYYELGDQIKVNHLNYPVKLKVIGFLRKGSYYPYENSTIMLDRMIVMPFLEFLDEPTEQYARFQKDHYDEKNWGNIGFDNNDNIAEITETFNNLCKKYDLFYQIRFPQDFEKPIKESQLTVIKQTKFALRLISIVFFAIISLVIMSLMIKNIDLNKKRYAIYLICGSNLTKLKIKVFAVVGLIYSLGYLISFIVVYGLMNKLLVKSEFLKTLFLPIGEIYGVMVLVLILVLNRYIKKLNFTYALRQR